jgi:hypothetical protein
MEEGAMSVWCKNEQAARASEEFSQTRCSVDAGFSPFADGEKVEYYSSTHSSWLPAVICGSHVSVGREGEMRFDVLIGAGQNKRTGVELAKLRPRFQIDEAVELLSKSEAWIPATVLADRGATLGYTIKADGTQEALARIPADRLRRRFVAGDDVMVLSPTEGWLQCVVASPTTSSFFAQHPSLPEATSPEPPCMWVPITVRRRGLEVNAISDERWAPSYFIYKHAHIHTQVRTFV